MFLKLACLMYLSVVEGWISEIQIFTFLRHFLTRDLNCLAKTLEMDDFTFPQKANDITDIWVVREAKDIIIGDACLLLCCDLVRTTYTHQALNEIIELMCNDNSHFVL